MHSRYSHSGSISRTVLSVTTSRQPRAFQARSYGLRNASSIPAFSRLPWPALTCAEDAQTLACEVACSPQDRSIRFDPKEMSSDADCDGR